MNIKFKQISSTIFAACLCISILQASQVAVPVTNDFEELPIATYQNTLSKMIENFIASIFKKQKAEQVTNIVPAAKKKIPNLSREQALHQIKETTTKLFDTNDANHISAYLNTMRDLAQNLDMSKDSKTIVAIHFLLQNQHRSNITDFIFWTKAIQEKELYTAIPMTPEVASRSNTEKLAILRKKMMLPKQI